MDLDFNKNCIMMQQGHIYGGFEDNVAVAMIGSTGDWQG